MLKKIIQRQAKCILIDAYANAFREDGTIWERKFELDSLYYLVLLTWICWKVAGDFSVFTPEVHAAFKLVFAVMLREQDYDGRRPNAIASDYHFQSDTQKSTTAPVNSTGMIWTAFRLSDDPCDYGFLIPSEMMVVQGLAALSDVARVMNDSSLEASYKQIRFEIYNGIQRFDVIHKKGEAAYYAYEADGFGHLVEMDDANLPSNLSAPYFGYPSI